MVTDEYIERVIKQGDKGSSILGGLINRTAGNCPYVSVEGRPYSLFGLRIPAGLSVVVHSSAGNDWTSLEAKAESLVSNLMNQAYLIGANPIGFTNIIDSRTGEDRVISALANSLEKLCHQRRLAVLNGENAILGNRIVGEANISGTMISIIDSRELEKQGIPLNGIYHGQLDHVYALFTSTGEFLTINSDGVGTKHEFYERAGLQSWVRANKDWTAMVEDDFIKHGGRAIVQSGVYEISRNAAGVVSNVPSSITKLCERFGVYGTLQSHFGEIQSYKPEIFAFNIGGSVVGTIPDLMLENLPHPSDGDHLMVIRGRPNPRSNGITSKREGMVKLLGEEWHESEWGKIFLDFLAEPSTVFYPVFKHLLDNKIATSVYHMSGGAFNSKLAKPLSKFGLYCEVGMSDKEEERLFEPDWRELALNTITSTTVEAAYSKCPNRNEAFITTRIPKTAKAIIRSLGLESRIVGKLEKRSDGKTGVRLSAFNGQEISFTGS